MLVKPRTSVNDDIVNTEQLARGVGARYLEVMPAHKPGILIACQWRRTIPEDTKDNRTHFLLDMAK